MAEEKDDEEGAPDVPASTPPDAGGPPTSAPAPETPKGGSAPTTLPAPSLDGLVVTPDQMEKTRQQLLAIQKAKMESQEADRTEITSRLDRDRARMEQAYKASAAEPAGLEPWDAQKKSAEHYTDPVQAFGSIGSVFAMLASSFAGLPMEAGLNAGAAAINAIHQGDEKAYNREFEAWQKNTDLAIKRHEIQRQAYNDATNLMNSNLNAGRTKMELAATKFGDQKVQALLENGMDKELTDLFVARNKSAGEMQDQWDKIQLQHDKVTDLRSDSRYTSGNPELKNQAIAEWTQRWAPNSSQKLRYDAKADYIAAQKRANPNWTPEDMIKWNTDFADAEAGSGESGGLKANTPEKAFIADKVKQLQAAENREPTADERLQWKQEWTTAQTKKSTSSGAQKAAAIKDIVDKAAAAGNPITLADATKQYNLTVATPSGNRLDDIDSRINQYENGNQAIDRTLALIDKHVGAVGVAGYATRLGERVGNIVGLNETDRSQLAHDIQYLQTIAPRLMQDASSRGLKADADKINSIIAGLNLGDTTANVKRALGEVRELWNKMQQDAINRRRGVPSPTSGAGPVTGAASDSGTSTTKTTAPAKPKWQSAPIVGPRSDAESETAYG